MKKICKICHAEFNGHFNAKCCNDNCKKLNKKRLNKQYYEDNIELILGKNTQWKADNPTRLKELNKRWYQNNTERVKTNNRRYKIRRRSVDPIYKTIDDLRKRTYHFLQTKQWKKQSHIKDIIGCTPEELQDHLDKTFNNNYGRDHTNKDHLHIDHIIPLCAAETASDIEKLNHFSNLQYLLKSDNLAKGRKYNTLMGAKHDILDLINKKASKIRGIRERTSRDFDHKKLVIEFFKAMDKHYAEAEDAPDLKYRYKKERMILYSRLRAIHPHIGVNINWNHDEAELEWTEYRVQSVMINFPPDVAVKLNVPEQEMIDVGDILLEILDL